MYGVDRQPPCKEGNLIPILQIREMRLRWVNRPTQFMQPESENVIVKAKCIRPQISLHSTLCQGILEEVVVQVSLEECKRTMMDEENSRQENSLIQGIAW